MNDALIVLNVRTIGECLNSLETLDIRRVHVIGHTEAELAAGGFAQALDATRADWVWVVADDVIVRQHALDAVRYHAPSHPVVTGYSQWTHTDWRVNLARSPLAGDEPKPGAYDFMDYQDVVSSRNPLIRSWFAGMSLTGMSRQMWERFPFQCFGDDPGWASDFALSLRLQQEQIPIVGVRDAFIYHWRWYQEATNGVEDMRPSWDDKRIEVRHRSRLLASTKVAVHA